MNTGTVPYKAEILKRIRESGAETILTINLKDKENQTRYVPGTNIWVTDKIGIKLMGQMVSASQSMGGSFYFGTGGSGAGLSSYSTVFQWSLGVGLAIKFAPGSK